MQILSVSQLYIKFQSSDVPAVKHIAFTLHSNETLGVVGESGSGKSATFLALLKLLPSDTVIQGEALLYANGNSSDVTNLVQANEKQMQQIRGRVISIIFQEPMTSLNPSMRCGKQVEEALRLHIKTSKVERYKKVLELFSEVALPEPDIAYHKYPHQLSGGQRQRVMIAMALACNPRILIADEPTTALDVTTQKEILELLKRIQKERQLAIVFISHDLGVIQKIADRIIVMRKGEVVETGSTGDILSNPTHPYTRALLACRPPLHTKRYRLPVIQELEQNQHTAEKTNQIRQAPNYDANPIIEINDLHVWFKDHSLVNSHKKKKNVLSQINLKIWKGETLGIVGESGSGKTTLGRTIMQLINSYDGSISFNGVPINQLLKKNRKQFRRSIQLIFQDPYSSLNPHITIGEAIREPIAVHKLIPNGSEQRERVFQLLQAVNLSSEYYYRYPHQLSGGQRQRIVIARALAMNPEIIICDESVSALDVSIAAQILNLLNDLKEKYSLTYLFISHDLKIVRYMSDRIIVLKNGCIIEENKADEIYLRPQHEYTKKLIDCTL